MARNSCIDFKITNISRKMFLFEHELLNGKLYVKVRVYYILNCMQSSVRILCSSLQQMGPVIPYELDKSAKSDLIL